MPKSKAIAKKDVVAAYGRKPSYTDQFQLIILGKLEATPQQEVKLEQFTIAFTLLCEGHPTRYIIKVLKRKYGLQERQCHQIIRDSQNVYAPVDKVNHKARKLVYAELFRRLGKLAEQAKDFQAAARAYENAAKIEGVYEDENKSLMDPRAFLKPSTVIFLDDPSVLEEMEAEDAEFEDLHDEEEEGAPQQEAD